jgi:hypothetical protein
MMAASGSLGIPTVAGPNFKGTWRATHQGRANSLSYRYQQQQCLAMPTHDCLSDSIDDEDEAMAELALRLGDLVDLVGGSAHVFQLLVRLTCSLLYRILCIPI